jgi:hypothetical protein
MAHRFILILSEVEGRTMTAPRLLLCYRQGIGIAPIFEDA